MATSKENIAIVVSRFPYPLEKGDKLRIYHQIRVLSEIYDVNLIAVSHKNISDEAKKKLEKYCRSVSVYKLSKLATLWNLGLQLISQKPFQVGYFFQRSIKNKIHREIRDLSPKHIYCQLIRSAEYVKTLYEFPKTLDYMDALSKGMERRIGTENWVKNIFVKWESKKLKDYENSVFDYFDHHTIISNQDKDFIIHRDRAKIKVVPNGIDTSFFKNTNSSKAYEIGFVGNLSYPPNIQASSDIVKNILPRLTNQKIKVLISGASPSKEVAKLEKLPEVKVTGWVDDIRDSYSLMKIFVAPLQIGTGLQNKLLEAMSMSIPCVTTTLVNNALGGLDKENILIADNFKEFSEKIELLLKDKKQAQLIGENGRKFVLEKYDWKSSTQPLISVLNQ